MEVIDIEIPDVNVVETNGVGPSKRKSRGSLVNKVSYAEAESSEEDDEPLVRFNPPFASFGIPASTSHFAG